MSKIKTTRKAMKEAYDKIICIGYCNAQYLLQYREPIAYSTRAEGWACDYYDIDGVLISTGYAPIDNKRASYDYKTLREYEQKASTIICSWDKYTSEEKVETVNILLKEFVLLATNK